MQSLLTPERFFVIIPAYNCGEYIRPCLDSLLTQTFTGWTALVADDGSDDDTSERVRPFLDDPRIRLRTGNERAWLMGNTLAALRSLSLRPNDVAAVVDGDDWLAPTCLERLWERHLAGFDLVYADDEIQGGGHSVGRPFIRSAPARAQAWCFAHPRSFKGYLFNLLTDNTFRDRDGNYFRCAGDLSLALPMAELAGPEKIDFVDEPLYHYRVHGSCNFKVMRDEQLRNNWDIRSRTALRRQTEYFDFVHPVEALEKSGIDALAREVRASYPAPFTVNIRHRIAADEADSWRAYHNLWVEEGVFLSGDVAEDGLS
ncbi:glycosyltransferase family 2 protein [Pseudodesulfovibrio sp.]|uniref:glycosyltransferase family 2 protein n=1 Tax=unclassified Pseudodesulfovibrio TaxID=2661612 RepID=UPI003AFFDD49